MKILYVATVLSHICQFHLPHLKALKEQGHEVHVAAHDNLAVKNGLQLRYADRHIEIPFERTPFRIQNIRAYRMLKALIDSENYDLIVCNTPVGGILTRLAARRARKHGAKVVYIVHGFHFYKGAPIRNWILYYPLEKHMARLCDVVVTVNEEDYRFAKDRFPGRVEHICGIGVDSERFHPATEEEQRAMRLREGLADEDFTVLCTGELNENKNQKTLVSATALLKDKIPNLKVLLVGNGPKEAELKAQIRDLGLENTVRMLGYRTDLERIVPAVDAVASCSRREGLPLNIVEAMLCEKPVVTSDNRGHRELVENGVNGFIFLPEDSEGLAENLLQIGQKHDLARTMGLEGSQKARQYTVNEVKKQLRVIVFQLMQERGEKHEASNHIRHL